MKRRQVGLRERRAAPDERPGRPVPDAARYLAPLCQRFGFALETFAELVVLEHGRNHVAIADARLVPPDVPAAALDGVGLLFVRTRMAQPKLTTAAAQRFGPHARRNVVLLAREAALRYQQRETLALTSRESALVSSPGPVLVACGDQVTTAVFLGTGLCRGDLPALALESYYPRSAGPCR